MEDPQQTDLVDRHLNSLATIRDLICVELSVKCFVCVNPLRVDGSDLVLCNGLHIHRLSHTLRSHVNSSVSFPRQIWNSPIFQLSNFDSIHHDALQILSLANFSIFSNFSSTRLDVLHLVTLDLFCYASVICDHSNSFNVDVFQLIIS